MDHYRFGPTRFSVIPCVAVGKISIRFVPRQCKEKMIHCLKSGHDPTGSKRSKRDACGFRNHVEHEFAKLRSKNRVSVEVLTSGDWWEAKMHSKYFNMAKNAILRVWGKPPLTVREGGTMPLASSLEQVRVLCHRAGSKGSCEGTGSRCFADTYGSGIRQLPFGERENPPSEFDERQRCDSYIAGRDHRGTQTIVMGFNLCALRCMHATFKTALHRCTISAVKNLSVASVIHWAVERHWRLAGS